MDEGVDSAGAVWADRNPAWTVRCAPIRPSTSRDGDGVARAGWQTASPRTGRCVGNLSTADTGCNRSAPANFTHRGAARVDGHRRGAWVRTCTCGLIVTGNNEVDVYCRWRQHRDTVARLATERGWDPIRHLRGDRRRRARTTVRQAGRRSRLGPRRLFQPAVADIVKTAVLSEECGEVARAVLDNDIDQLRTELIQVAAVAVAWLEAL